MLRRAAYLCCQPGRERSFISCPDGPQLLGCSTACRSQALTTERYTLHAIVQVKRKKILPVPVYPTTSEPVPDSVWLQEDAAEPKAEDTAMAAADEPMRHFDCAESRAVTFQRVHEKG